jgi:hypothetical protein
LAPEVSFGFFLHSFDHIESDFHFGHAALVDLTTLENLLCHLDVVFPLLEDVLIFVIGLIPDLVHLKLFLSISLLIYDLELVVFELANGELKLLQSLLENFMRIWDVTHLNLINQYKNVIPIWM